MRTPSRIRASAAIGRRETAYPFVYSDWECGYARWAMSGNVNESANATAPATTDRPPSVKRPRVFMATLSMQDR